MIPCCWLSAHPCHQSHAFQGREHSQLAELPCPTPQGNIKILNTVRSARIPPGSALLQNNLMKALVQKSPNCPAHGRNPPIPDFYPHSTAIPCNSKPSELCPMPWSCLPNSHQGSLQGEGLAALANSKIIPAGLPIPSAPSCHKSCTQCNLTASNVTILQLFTQRKLYYINVIYKSKDPCPHPSVAKGKS